MHFICRSFTGKADSQNWSQYWENEPDDFQLKADRGHLFGLLSLNSNKEEDLKNIGHDLIFEINQNYFAIDEEESSDTASALKKTLESVNKNPLYKDYSLEVVLLVIKKNKSYIVSLGPSKVSLNRQSTITLLIDDKESDQSIKFISGPIKSGDRFFLSNSNFFKKVTWPKIKLILSEEKIQNIEENFLSSIYSFEDQKNLSALLIETKEDDLSAPLISETEETVLPVGEKETSKESELKTEIVESEPNIEKTNKFISQSKAKSKSFLNKIFNKESSSVFVGEYISQETSKRKKLQIIVAVVLLIALFTSIFFGYKKNQKIKTEKNYQTLKIELSQQLNEATTVKSLSLETAQTRAKEAEKLLKEMVLLEIHSDETVQFQSQIDLLLSQTGLNENFQPEFFYDTANIVSNPKYSSFFINNKSLYLFDSSSGRVDKLGIKDKPNNLVVKTDKSRYSKKIIGNIDDLYFLFDDNIGRIDGDEFSQEIIFADSDPSPSVTDFQVWNGSIYVLDNQNQTIWKYAPSASTFSQAQNWIKNSKELELGPISIDIDGEIWVLYENGEVENYISGVKDNFSLKGGQQFNKANNLTVSLEEDGFISFLDGQSLVFVYKKSGEFVAKYNLGKLKISDLNLDNDIIYLLASDQKVYQIKL